MTTSDKFLPRKVLLTNDDGKVTRVVLRMPGNNILNPPKFLFYRHRLYTARGNGLGCNFYREVPECFEVNSAEELTREEFSKISTTGAKIPDRPANT